MPSELTSVRALVIGAGSIGLRHAENLKALGVTQIAFLRSGKGSAGLDQKRNATLDALGASTFFSEPEALKWKPTVVIVANPTSLHLSAIRFALENNCSVFVEKPISDSLSGLEELRSQLKSTQLKSKGSDITLGCQMRFHPLLRKVKKIISEDGVGRPLFFESEVGSFLGDWHPWENFQESYAAKKTLGGGVVLTLIHEIDYLHWIFGSLKSVFAVGGSVTPLQIEAEDLILATLETKSGVFGHLRMDFWQKPEKRFLKVVGTEKTIELDLVEGLLSIIDRNGKIEREKAPAGLDRNQLHQDALREFLTKPSSIPRIGSDLSEGIEALQTALAVKNSLSTSSIVIINN